MSRSVNTEHQCTVADICREMESIAPTGLAQSWDNVGLLAGDPSAGVRRVLLCVDLTPAVVDEAIGDKANLILAYHPPIFKPIPSLRADSPGAEAVVFRCIENRVAVYATHTALDAAEGGTNDVIATLCGVKEAEPIEWVDKPVVSECKLVVFVPKDEVETVANAMFAAGAGHIGDYSRCSFRTAGQGTFFGGETTNPAVGERERIEFADEIRLESVVPSKAIPAVVGAMVNAHPYEEPAFDIHSLTPRPVRGVGRVGRLARTTTLTSLARRLKRKTQAACVRIVGPGDRAVDRAVIMVGAAGSLPFRMPLTLNDVIVTGEIRHHDALTVQRRGCTAIALGHWTSERPALIPLAERLQSTLPGLAVRVSTEDREPLRHLEGTRS